MFLFQRKPHIQFLHLPHPQVCSYENLLLTNGKLKINCGLLHHESIEEDSVFLIKRSIQKFYKIDYLSLMKCHSCCKESSCTVLHGIFNTPNSSKAVFLSSIISFSAEEIFQMCTNTSVEIQALLGRIKVLVLVG